MLQKHLLVTCIDKSCSFISVAIERYLRLPLLFTTIIRVELLFKLTSKIMKAVFALLALTLATANAGNIMDLITEQSVGGKIVEITLDGCDQDHDEECIAERGSTVSTVLGRLICNFQFVKKDAEDVM